MMRKWLVVLILLVGSLSAFAVEGKDESRENRELVYKVDIKDEIGPSIWRLVKRSFDRATDENADVILVHMNTYGGMVVYADSLRSLILNYPKPVWVFIDNNAASAGALISIACDRIYMREGANIGAATVVNQTGDAMPDKYQSYMRSMIRATAQAHGKDTVMENGQSVIRWKRDPRIAEAMVDERVVVEGVTDSGKVVTFTPHEAMQYGFCDGIAENVAEVLQKEGVTNYELHEYKPTTMDRFIGFLISPIVQGILIMIIIGGIYFELQTPGIGFPLVAAITACLLYFAPLYLEGMANYVEMIFVVSCSLLSLFGSIWLSRKLFGSRRLNFALHAEQKVEDGFVGVDMAAKEEIGKEGIAFTDLRPAGKVMIGNEVYDAVSDTGAFIERGKVVRVVKYQAGQVYVVMS